MRRLHESTTLKVCSHAYFVNTETSLNFITGGSVLHLVLALRGGLHLE